MYKSYELQGTKLAIARWSLEGKNTYGPVLFQETLIEK